MAYISEAKHFRLVKQLFIIIEQEQPNEQDKNGFPFKKDLELITDSFSAYKKEIARIHNLINEYQQMHKRARMNLRKYRRTTSA